MEPELENELVQWILAEDRASLAPTYTRIRSMAVNILTVHGQDIHLGEK